MRDETNRDRTLAWLVAALSRQQKIPLLSQLLLTSEPVTRVQAQAVAKANLHMLADAYGWKVRAVMKRDKARRRTRHG